MRRVGYAAVLACLSGWAAWRFTLPVAGLSPIAADARVHWMAAGDVDSGEAVLWTRCQESGPVRFQLWKDGREDRARVYDGQADAVDDLTARARIVGLDAATEYRYRIWCGDRLPGASSDAPVGHFRTAPLPDARRAVRFAWGGDLGGQNVCRHQTHGYDIFRQIERRQPDFFIALGDMIYADGICGTTSRYGYPQVPGPAVPALQLEQIWEHWRYNRSDRAHAGLLAATSMYAVWDDHEIADDAGPHHDSVDAQSGLHLLPPARQAFLDYVPYVPPAAEPERLYHSARWGQHAEIFFLDTRQYRDPNQRNDDPAAPKSMLGAAQRAWLIESVKSSTATWRIIISSVPLAIPTGSPAGRDGWADFDGRSGFENELLAILRAWSGARVRNLLWLTTDVHFAAAFHYAPFPDDAGFTFNEVATGPLTAGVFPKTEYDTTLRPERLFLYRPGDFGEIRSYEEATRWFNFGLADIDAEGTLILKIVNGRGEEVYELRLSPHS